jgi:hypothetical protein
MSTRRYYPVKENRFFTAGQKYSDIDWNSLDAAVEAFDERIQKWYIEPIQHLISASVHFGFPVIGLTCLLIDTLSQYSAGELESSRNKFKKFVQANLSSFSQSLPTPIDVPQPNGSNRSIVDYADVLYSGFRCGILHEANVTPYGVIASGIPTTTEFHLEGITKYVDNTNCPSIIINPNKLFDEVNSFHQAYIKDLKNKNAQYDDLRIKFKKKFAWSFGIDIGNE